MARQRMIKPEFFESETTGACSVAARILFISLWVHGDDYGNMKVGLSKLRTSTFRYDQMTDKELLDLLVELEEVECIRGYSIDNEPYLNVPNFKTYQYVKKPSKSNVPSVPDECPRHTDFFAVWKECGLQAALVRHQYGTSTESAEKEHDTELVRHQYGTSVAKRKKERKKEVTSSSKEELVTERKVARVAAVDESTPRATEMICPECGSPMSRTGMRKTNTDRYYWRCPDCDAEVCE